MFLDLWTRRMSVIGCMYVFLYENIHKKEKKERIFRKGDSILLYYGKDGSFYFREICVGYIRPIQDNQKDIYK
jgi:hypothetical protein